MLNGHDGSPCSGTVGESAAVEALEPRTFLGVGLGHGSAQLKPFGYEINIEQVKNIGEQLAQSQDFDAAMYSANMLVTGDPLYIFNQTLVKGGPANYGGYANAELEVMLQQLRGETDPTKRQALSKQAQEVIKTDMANIYLLVVPFIAATSKNVKGYTLHPSDLYIVDNQISVAS